MRLARPAYLDPTALRPWFITPADPDIKAELEAAINTYIKIRNSDPKPFRWLKSADDILASIERFCRRTIVTQDTAA